MTEGLQQCFKVVHPWF